MKTKLVFALLFALGLTGQVMARDLRIGNFNYQGESYYSNGMGADCQYEQFEGSYPRLSPRQKELLNYARFDGYCDEGGGVSVRRGHFNLRGTTYFSNGQGAYCERARYNFPRWAASC